MPFKQNTGGVYVWVQPDEKPRFFCTVITRHHDGENTLCGEGFHTVDDLVAHASKCAREHEQEIMEASPSRRLGALGPQNQTDWEDWLDKRDAAGESNRAKVIQGRKKL